MLVKRCFQERSNTFLKEQNYLFKKYRHYIYTITKSIRKGQLSLIKGLNGSGKTVSFHQKTLPFFELYKTSSLFNIYVLVVSITLNSLNYFTSFISKTQASFSKNNYLLNELSTGNKKVISFIIETHLNIENYVLDELFSNLDGTSTSLIKTKLKQSSFCSIRCFNISHHLTYTTTAGFIFIN